MITHSFMQSTELVGRLGFEPRQTASKAVDLPLVDRPVLSARFKLADRVTLRTRVAIRT